eukprot:jgi/Tetstr1/448201/TSEL_035490.t1
MGACVFIQKNPDLDAKVKELLASYDGEAAFSAVAADLLKPCGEDWLASEVLDGEGEGEASRIQWEAVESMLEHGASTGTGAPRTGTPGTDGGSSRGEASRSGTPPSGGVVCAGHGQPRADEQGLKAGEAAMKRRRVVRKFSVNNLSRFSMRSISGESYSS